MHAIVKQITKQLKEYLSGSDEKGYLSLYPFDLSKDYYSSPLKAFTDPRNGKEYILEYKNDKDRLANIKKINTAITSYNKVAAKNYKEFISKLPTDGKVYSPDDFGFKKPTIPFNEHPIWAYGILGYNVSLCFPQSNSKESLFLTKFLILQILLLFFVYLN